MRDTSHSEYADIFVLHLTFVSCLTLVFDYTTAGVKQGNLL
jgi:hypothetical protein